MGAIKTKIIIYSACYPFTMINKKNKMKGNQTMDADKFRQMLEASYGHRPFYYRVDPECRIMRGKTPAAMANDDCTGKGLKPFYNGKKAAYLTKDLIELAVSRFSAGQV